MAATSTSDAPSTDGPVLNLINKRIRALRKKQNRIIQMEESLSQGKSLNKEQQEVLRSKPGILALIDELEKLRSPLSAAVSEEISLAIQNRQPIDGNADVREAEEAPPSAGDGDGGAGVLEDLLNLLYFGSLFDVMPQSDFTSMMLTRTHERGCCLTYDYVTDDATDLLGERDLDLIAALKGLMISRPTASSLSHKNALQRCIEHAKLWLSKSDQLIDPQSNVTYGVLREKLSKIISSDYYTTTPEMRGPVEMAAAAGVASFGSFQVPVQGSVVPATMPVQADDSVGKYQEEENTNAEDNTTTEEQQQTVPAEELQKDNLDIKGTAEEVSTQADQENSRAEEEEQSQYAPRRPYQNQRGGGGRGGRRGYPNGRGGRGAGRGGGGSYQNGRSQYYDQGGSYYPRNNHRGRGGRGGGGNSYYNNHPSEGEAGHAQSNVGLAS